MRMRTRSGDLLRTRSIIHRRGDSFSSLRSDENAGDLEDPEQRPLFFMHGVGLGLVSVHCLSCGRLLLQDCRALMNERPPWVCSASHRQMLPWQLLAATAASQTTWLASGDALVKQVTCGCADCSVLNWLPLPVQIPYLGLVQQILWACPDRPMILLEVPHVSLRLQLRAMSVDDVAHAAAQILWRHSYQEACFVAHSYGTFCASRICQLHRSLVHSMVSMISSMTMDLLQSYC